MLIYSTLTIKCCHQRPATTVQLPSNVLGNVLIPHTTHVVNEDGTKWVFNLHSSCISFLPLSMFCLKEPSYRANMFTRLWVLSKDLQTATVHIVTHSRTTIAWYWHNGGLWIFRSGVTSKLHFKVQRRPTVHTLQMYKRWCYFCFTHSQYFLENNLA